MDDQLQIVYGPPPADQECLNVADETVEITFEERP